MEEIEREKKLINEKAALMFAPVNEGRYFTIRNDQILALSSYQQRESGRG